MKISKSKTSKNQVDQLEKLKFEQIEIILRILGLVETKGKLFNPKSNFITYEKIDELLETFYEFKEQNKSRQIKNAFQIFNRLSKDFQVKGNRKGTSFISKNNSNKNLKSDKAYISLFVIYLGLLFYKEILHLDFFSQIMELEFPLDFLSTIQYAVEEKIPISFPYRSDRNNKNIFVEKFIPVKIYFKESHWYLVGWESRNQFWNQYLLHSIRNISILDKSLASLPKEKFDLNEFRKNSFGATVLGNVPVSVIEIEVPEEHQVAVRKRRKEGTWENKGNKFIWKVNTYDPNEVFDYVIRWNGILKIVSPIDIKKKFKEKLKKLIQVHK
jgi:hypothetical protein